MRAVVLSLASRLAACEAMQTSDSWARFKEAYGKRYGSVEEERQRRAQFELNLAEISAENAKNHTYALGITEFADESAEEFAATHLGMAPRAGAAPGGTRLGAHLHGGQQLPSSVDWTMRGAVTPVKNQGTCGSCWSFSTTGALEGAWKLASGRLVSLSEEQFMDCSGNHLGCLGGLMDKAFAYAEENHVCTEASYPYRGLFHLPFCHERSCSVGIPKGSVRGYKDVAHSESALMSAVAQQPVSVAVDAGPWQHYSHGVLQKRCGTKLDHGVLAVGYGTDGALDYWKVKNSWGARWGEHGYVRVLRGKGGSGECGILLEASYPVVSSSEALV